MTRDDGIIITSGGSALALEYDERQGALTLQVSDDSGYSTIRLGTRQVMTLAAYIVQVRRDIQEGCR